MSCYRKENGVEKMNLRFRFINYLNKKYGITNDSQTQTEYDLFTGLYVIFIVPLAILFNFLDWLNEKFTIKDEMGCVERNDKP
jgi:hypothetical protein